MTLYACVLIFKFLLVSCILVYGDTNNGSSGVTCPVWTRPSSSHEGCKCGDHIEGAVICNEDTKSVYIDHYYCVFFSGHLNSTLIGTCPYGQAGFLSKSLSKLRDNSPLCSCLHRKGQLCGECDENYTLPAYSYYLGCVKCGSFKNGWIGFVAAAFLPLTVFYMIVVVFRISATSAALNGYVLVSQIISMPAMIRFLYTDNHPNAVYHVSPSTEIVIDFGIAVYAILEP